MIKNKKVVGVILSYNHARFLESLYQSLPKDVYDSVIITNDETGDGIEKIADKLGIPCFSHPRFGYGGNLKYGLKKALELGADYAVEIHGDGQFDVGVSKEAVLKASEGYDFVTGNRFYDLLQPLRDKMPFIRYVSNIGLSAIARFITGVRIGEFHDGYRIYSRRLLETIPLEKTSNDFLFAFEVVALTKRARLRIAEVPIRSFYGQDHSSISIPRSIKFALQSFWSYMKYLLARIGIRLYPYN